MEYIEESSTRVAVVDDDKVVTADAWSALDLAMSARYEGETSLLAVKKEAVCDDFFMLSTGVAGEILQKFVNYRIKMAVWGDFSRYTSKPLRDFIRESNEGRDFFFVDTKEEAIGRLANAR